MLYLDLLIHFQHFKHCLNDISKILYIFFLLQYIFGFLKYL